MNSDRLIDIIRTKINSARFYGSEFTVIHKIASYKSFLNLLMSDNRMFDYLINNSRSGGFQCKLFQQYLIEMENQLPYVFRKNKKQQQFISSITDDQLNIFSGLSNFSSIVDRNLKIMNNTQEFYVGGRSASYAKPYYIGKLLNITNKLNQSLLDNVVHYTFNYIQLQNVEPNVEVNVQHLRIPPHYQMGGMTYINRARIEILNEYCKNETA